MEKMEITNDSSQNSAKEKELIRQKNAASSEAESSDDDEMEMCTDDTLMHLVNGDNNV